MTTPKSPDTIMKEFEEKFTKENPGWRETGATGELLLNTNVPVYIQNFLRSSMASLLCYMAERIPTYEDFNPNIEVCDVLKNCRTLLIEEARKIAGEERTEEEAAKIQALSNMLMFVTGKKPNE